ncbi:TadE/TadG family type IV pilus assembly protein [Agromyces sp. MMS24-JH15]|uniref:TadE/TadG family type IV pilus assembly protein n=1 Tax=Agromyces sp. MMS24-JH15 TaxID=3243765 RepID=UPI00374974D2
MFARLVDERGSAVAEFALVGVILTALALAVVQLALALHVRNTLLDAAAEGARYAALAGASTDDGVARTRALIGAALSDGYAADVSGRVESPGGVEVVAITVRAAIPVIGLLGPERGLEVTGHAAVEGLD